MQLQPVCDLIARLAGFGHHNVCLQAAALSHQGASANCFPAGYAFLDLLSVAMMKEAKTETL